MIGVKITPSQFPHRSRVTRPGGARRTLARAASAPHIHHTRVRLPDTRSETDMTTDTTDRMKIVIYYAIWATICAALAGLVIAGLHTWLFSYIPSRSGLIFTMVSDAVTALAIAAGQGAGALVTGGVLARVGNPLQRTGLLGLLLGAFDFAMRSEEHTSELQSPCNLVCRLLLEKKKTSPRVQNYSS